MEPKEAVSKLLFYLQSCLLLRYVDIFCSAEIVSDPPALSSLGQTPPTSSWFLKSGKLLSMKDPPPSPLLPSLPPSLVFLPHSVHGNTYPNPSSWTIHPNPNLNPMISTVCLPFVGLFCVLDLDSANAPSGALLPLSSCLEMFRMDLTYLFYVLLFFSANFSSRKKFAR